MILESILMFIIGSVFVYGGGTICKQAFEDAKNVLESTIFGILIVAAGLTLVTWSFTGIPGCADDCESSWHIEKQFHR